MPFVNCLYRTKVNASAFECRPDVETVLFNISAVERETGLSKDTLRIWERRYHFPQPVRDSNGDRAYTTEQITKLRLIKRLLNQGHRPGKVIGLDDAHLERLVTQPTRDQPTRHDMAVYVQLVRSHQGLELRRHLAQAMAPRFADFHCQHSRTALPGHW